MPRTPKEYSVYLSQRRNALAHFQQTEETSSTIEKAITPSDIHRKLVFAAFLDANGDPADGRWSLVTHLCRLDSTRWGYRWLGARAERRNRRRSVTGKNSQCTEKKRNDESRLIQKVESWKRTVTLEMANNVNHVTGSPGTQATLGFKVAKRAAFTNISKSSSHHRPDPHKLQAVNVSSPDSSFLPPSFPSHLVTSTQQPTGRHKPPSIPHNSSPSHGEIKLYDGTYIPDENAESISKPDAPWDASIGAGPGQLNFLGLLNDSDEDDFNPFQTSTQKRIDPRGATSTGAQWNPQFDVDQRVGEVVKLLDDDVGWYRTS